MRTNIKREQKIDEYVIMGQTWAVERRSRRKKGVVASLEIL